MNVETRKGVQEEQSAPESTPKPMTAAQNAVLTVIVLAAAAVVMALLFVVDKVLN
ncbi:MAG: hypothetical protein IT165_29910 [Bryobacterales bacterium]|nr:hypothetical protein [Bryobacterales bacterium]